MCNALSVEHNEFSIKHRVVAEFSQGIDNSGKSPTQLVAIARVRSDSRTVNFCDGTITVPLHLEDLAGSSIRSLYGGCEHWAESLRRFGQRGTRRIKVVIAALRHANVPGRTREL